MSDPTFRKSHPIAFSLYGEDHHYVLYIADDPEEEHRLTLELHNVSAQAIQFTNGLAETASATNHHVELVFRPGTLSAKTLDLLRHEKAKILAQATEWDLHVPDGGDNQTVSLYFLYKGQGRIFKYNERRILTLQHISAAAGGGARGTRVELIPHQLTYTDDPTPITGRREQHLHITNHRGQKHIPLHVGFVGSNRILNDGSSSTLTLRITNLLREDAAKGESGRLALNPEGTKDTSQFTIYFDVDNDDQKDWALAAKEHAKDIHIYLKSPKGQAQDPCEDMSTSDDEWNIQGPFKVEKASDLKWVLTPKKLALAPGEVVELHVCNIKSSLPSGHTNLYLRYEHIPGYWDGQFVCPIEKAPLLFCDVRDDEGKFVGNNVGIGIADPQTKLHIVDKEREQYTNLAKFEGPVKIKVSNLPAGRSALYISANYESAGSGSAACLNSKSDGPTLYAEQLGGGNAAHFSGCVRINGGVRPADDYHHALHISATSAEPALKVEQTGKGKAAEFYGSVSIQCTSVDEEADTYYEETVAKFFGDKDVSALFESEHEDGREVYLRFKNKTTENNAWMVGMDDDNEFKIAYGEDGEINDDIAKLTITRDGKVGIGTPDPKARLEIKGATADAQGASLHVTDSKGNSLLYVRNDGNVGIGADGPNFRLDVRGDQGWIGSGDNSQVEGGWRLGRWPANTRANQWLYLSRADKAADDGTTYQNLAVGDLWVSGKIQAEQIQDHGGNRIFHMETIKHLDGKTTKSLFISPYLYLRIDDTYYLIQRKKFTWTDEHYAALDAYKTSDLRFKKDVSEISGALDKITRLSGVAYHWNEDGLKRFTRDIENTISAGPEATPEENQKLWDAERERRCAQLSGTNIGLIAQEVESVVPEVVHADEEGYKSIDYGRLTALLIEGIKEQNALIEGLRARVAALENVTI